MSLVVQVQLRKSDRLYINDGIYGSLSEMVTANLRLPARVVRLKGPTSPELTPFKLFGPTCDSVDVLPGTFDLPSDVAEGDWIEIDRLGAYSNSNATRFNGFYPETLVLVDDEPVPV
jgi:ornithine decarboxylase